MSLRFTHVGLTPAKPAAGRDRDTLLK